MKAKKEEKSPADITLDTIVQIRSLLGCSTDEALHVYQQLLVEAKANKGAVNG